MEWQFGIDTAAHKGALQVGGNTIAVLGCGFNNIFPKENTQLYYSIIKNNGLVISEYAPDIEAKSKYFLERNRIVSGISLGILIVEAMYRSGTSVTARLAQEQGRKVFVLPHEIDNKNGVGTNNLIKKGANLVTSVKEIIDEFHFLKYKNEEIKIDKKTLNKNQKNISQILSNSYNLKHKSRKTNMNEMKENIFNKKELVSKNENCKKIYGLINSDVINIEELYKKTNMDLSQINESLFYLEIEGYIKKVSGGYKCILNKK